MGNNNAYSTPRKHFRARCILPWTRRRQSSPKRWYPTATLHGVTTQKTSTQIFGAVKTSNVTDVNLSTYNTLNFQGAVTLPPGQTRQAWNLCTWKGNFSNICIYHLLTTLKRSRCQRPPEQPPHENCQVHGEPHPSPTSPPPPINRRCIRNLQSLVN
jgi:hypothetical protein